MKKLSVFLLLIFSAAFITAQEINLLDIDLDMLDSIFDESVFVFETPVQEVPAEAVSPIIRNIRRRGLEVSASYEFMGGINPGWEVYPWELTGEEHFSWAIGVKMGSTVGITAQISEVFRIRSEIRYEMPGFNFVLGDFFFDYNFFDKVFLRAGKYEQGWGISRNFGFTNLLSRVPVAGPSGPSYIMKFDAPVGIGGLQILTMTRVNMAGGAIPTREEMGFGGKYNLAYRWADFDMGIYYQKEMATRGFFSIKTTILDTELYNEWLVAVDNHTDDAAASLAFNLGFARSFANDKFELNGEFFYNGEGYTYFYKPETDFREAGTSPFLEGLNIAINFLYRFGGRWNPRFYTGLLYAAREESLSLIPGFRISPVSNIDIYFAVPVALGNREGHYYQSSRNIKNELRPFSVLLYITFSGSVHAAHYY